MPVCIGLPDGFGEYEGSLYSVSVPTPVGGVGIANLDPIRETPGSVGGAGNTHFSWPRPFDWSSVLGVLDPCP